MTPTDTVVMSHYIALEIRVMPGCKINCISKVLMWSGMRKYQEKGVWEYSIDA